MFDPANQSETFKRFLEVFFGECTSMIIHDGIDVSPLYHLSVQEQSLAEDLMIEHLEKGKLDFRLVIGLGKLRSQRAIPLLINFLQRTDSGLSRIHPAIELRNFACQQVAQALDEALDDSDSLIRHHAAQSLLIVYRAYPSDLGLTLTRVDLSYQVMSDDPEIRKAAVALIRTLGKEKLLPTCDKWVKG